MPHRISEMQFANIADVSVQTWMNLPATLPLSKRLKVEFGAVNHLEGTAGFFTVSMPLAFDASVTSTVTGKAIKARF